MRYVRKFAKKARLEPEVTNGIVLTFRLLILIGALASLTKLSGVSTDWFLAFSALGGAALGFASQQTIGNFVAGLYLLATRPFRAGDLEDLLEVFGEYPNPTGRSWIGNHVDQMVSKALEEQPSGVFAAEIEGKVVRFAIVMHREWFGIAYPDYIQAKSDWMNKGMEHKLLERCVD